MSNSGGMKEISKRLLRLLIMVQIGLFLVPALSSASVTMPSKETRAIKKKVVALTFDDGPGTYTPGVLNALTSVETTATFFITGNAARSKRWASYRKKVVKAGHQIASHTARHSQLPKLSNAAIRADVEFSLKWIKKNTGQATKYVRPPYGATNARVRGQLKKLGVKEVLWSHDSNDWRYSRPTKASVDAIVRNCTRGMKTGSIILLHDGNLNKAATVKAIPRIVKAWRKKGYKFVTIAELDRLSKKKSKK